MKIFTRDVCSSAKEATQKSGIDKILPGIVIDDYLFEPCGYSMNGLTKGVSISKVQYKIFKLNLFFVLSILENLYLLQFISSGFAVQRYFML